MEVAVAGMPDHTDGEAVPGRDVVDQFQHAHELAAGHRGVFDDGGGPQARERRQGRPAGGPQVVALPHCLRDAH